MSTSLETIVARLQAAAKRPYLVAIDGRSGAGKSVFAERLREQVPDVVVVHKDDFYREMAERERAALDAEQGHNQYFDWQRLEREVLAPLSAGTAARYRRYDWVQEDLSAETIEVDPQKIVVVEGVASTRPELRSYYDFRIWVETSEKERVQRQLARTWDTMEWIRRWAAAEKYYVDTFEPMLTAEVIVAGE